MADRTEQAGSAAQEPTIHMVLVPEHLHEQVEEHVRQLVEEDVSAYMGIKLLTNPKLPTKSQLPQGPVYCAASCLKGGGYDLQLDSSATPA